MGIDQLDHWNSIYSENPSFFGDAPSLFCIRSAEILKTSGMKTVLELGPGQGRDTKYLLESGFSVIAADYSDISCSQLRQRFGDKLTVVQKDLRKGLDMPANSFDACYSHMLFTMNFTDSEISKLASDIYNALVPGGLFLFSVRNTNDACFGKGENLHGNTWENNGFAVRYYTQEDIKKMFSNFELVRISEFNEGQKILFSVIMKKPL